MRHSFVTPVAQFKEVLDGIRTADLKKDDRPYQVGDLLILQEFDGKNFTGRELELKLTLVSRDLQKQGLRNGHVFMCFNKGELIETKLPETVAATASATVSGNGNGQAAPAFTNEEVVLP